MKRYSFKNDYSDGAHPKILEALSSTNYTQEEGYGEDQYCKEAMAVLRKYLKNPEADIHFVSGGTQANLIVVSSLLKPFESVIAAGTAHIAVHEAGAVEGTGHKVNTVESLDGKLYPEQITEVLDFHIDEHMVKPKMVFISNSTEVGTIYSKKEVEKLSECCKQHNLLFFLDGARLGSALTSPANDLALPDLPRLVDLFYIGGTKNGALLGEAVIINNSKLKEDFRYHLKQKGALIAKGRVLGIQFLELFKNNLFFKIAKHANQMAFKLAAAVEAEGFKLLAEPVSNQIFPVLPNRIIEKLDKKYDFYVWNKINGEESVVRLVTSWNTEEEKVEEFILDLKTMVNRSTLC